VAETVTRTTISLPHDLVIKAEPRWIKLGYKSFSEYVTFLISSDIHEKPPHLLLREERGVSYSKSSTLIKRGGMRDNLGLPTEPPPTNNYQFQKQDDPPECAP
jgi:hypothetical protein